MSEMRTSTTRPLEVTVISWFFILWALLSVIPKVFLLIDPEAYRLAVDLNQAFSKRGFLYVPLWFQLTHAFAGVPVIVVSGIFMLRGQLWALLTFLLWILGVLGLTLAVSGFSISLYARLVTVAVVAILLTRPKSLAYFSTQQDTRKA